MVLPNAADQCNQQTQGMAGERNPLCGGELQINAQKRFARATAISDEFDDLKTNMQVRLLILAQ